MSVVQPPIPPPLSPLRGLSQNLYNAANRLNRLANDIDDVFLIGQYLSSPFYWIAYYLDRASDYCMDADDWLRELWGRVEGLYDGGVFKSLLFWVSYNYYQLAYNAVQWIRQQISLIGVDWMYLMYYPTDFVRVKLQLISYWLAQFLNNPEWVVTELLKRYISWMASFISNPTSFVIGLLAQYLPDIWTFLVNPIQFMINKLENVILDFNTLRFHPYWWVFQRLRELNPELTNLLYYTRNYLRSFVEGLFRFNPSFWDNPHFYLLDLLLDKLEVTLSSFQERLKRILIEFVLRFI